MDDDWGERSISVSPPYLIETYELPVISRDLLDFQGRLREHGTLLR